MIKNNVTAEWGVYFGSFPQAVPYVTKDWDESNSYTNRNNKREFPPSSKMFRLQNPKLNFSAAHPSIQSLLRSIYIT